MSVCNLPLASGLCDAVSEGAVAVVAAPFEWLATSMGGGRGLAF